MMSNTLSFRLALVGCVASCLMSAAHADLGTGESDDVVFVGLHKGMFPEVACVPEANLPATGRAVEITLQSTVPANLRLYDVQFVPFADDNSGVTFDFDVSGCISSTHPVTNYGQGMIMGFDSCVLTAEFIPPVCDNTGMDGAPVPMSAEIHQLLVVGLGSQEDYALLEAKSNVNVIGAGNEFAVLGYNQVPTNQGNGNSQLFGDLGLLNVPSDISGFTLPNTASAHYSPADDVVVGAETDLENAYFTLYADLGECLDNCIPYGSTDDKDLLTSGNYCLYDAANGFGIDVTLDGNLTLAGAGNFYFFMNPNQVCIADAVGPEFRMCNLRVGPHFNISYAADQNGNTPTAENVFWILGAAATIADDTAPNPPLVLGSTDISHMYLANGARLDGSVLGGAGFNDCSEPRAGSSLSFCLITGNNIIAEYSTGDRAAVVNGTLWSQFGLIELAGTTVSPAQ